MSSTTTQNTARSAEILQRQANETPAQYRARVASSQLVDNHSPTAHSTSPQQSASDSVGRSATNTSSSSVHNTGLANVATDSSHIQAAVSRLSNAQQQQLDTVRNGLTHAITSTPPDQNAIQQADTRFGALVRDATDPHGANPILGESFDVGAYVQYVLRDAYNSTTADMEVFAKKTKWLNDLKKEIRNELERARGIASSANVATLADTATLPTPPGPVTPKTFNTDPTAAGGAFSVDGTPLTTKAQLKSYIENLEQKLQTAGDDAQLAQVDLQNILQKQQQTLQLMSNISKMLHDTAMSVIRKIG